MSKKSTKPSIDKQNFIDFLASATPKELNKYIEEKGKPPKLWSPVYFFRYPEQVTDYGGKENERKHESG